MAGADNTTNRDAQRSGEWQPAPPVGIRLIERAGPMGAVVLKRRSAYVRAAAFGIVVATVPGLGLGAAVLAKNTAEAIVGGVLVAVGCPLTAWFVHRCLKLGITVDGTGLQICNGFSSQRVPWSAIETISTRFCQGGEGGSSWAVVITRRDTNRDVPISAFTFMSWLGSARAERRAQASRDRLLSLAPPGLGLAKM